MAMVYTVSFSVNFYGAAPPIAYVLEGTTVNRPADPTTTAEFYEFGGWYTTADCTTAYDFDSPVTNDMILYAKWNKATIARRLQVIAENEQKVYNAGYTAGYTEGVAIGSVGFDANAFFEGRLAEIVLPTVKKLKPYAIYNDTAIKKITTPQLEEISVSGIMNCKGITSLVFPQSLKKLNTQAIFNCTALTTVTFEGTPTSVGSASFHGCTALTDIFVPWSEGEVANAPWGASSAKIHYNSTAGG